MSTMLDVSILLMFSMYSSMFGMSIYVSATKHFGPLLRSAVDAALKRQICMTYHEISCPTPPDVFTYTMVQLRFFTVLFTLPPRLSYVTILHCDRRGGDDLPAKSTQV